MNENLKLPTANEMALLSKKKNKERLKLQSYKIFERIKNSMFQTVDCGFEDNCKTVIYFEPLGHSLSISRGEFLKIISDISTKLKELGYEVECFDHEMKISWLKGEQSE